MRDKGSVFGRSHTRAHGHGRGCLLSWDLNDPTSGALLCHYRLSSEQAVLLHESATSLPPHFGQDKILDRTIFGHGLYGS